MDAKNFEYSTQALGTVHQDEENNLNADNREYILDVLNYQMLPIFENLGYNVAGGESQMHLLQQETFWIII